MMHVLMGSNFNFDDNGSVLSFLSKDDKESVGGASNLNLNDPQNVKKMRKNIILNNKFLERKLKE